MPISPLKIYRKSKTSGFTLLEVMIVVAIIAAVVVIAIPSFTNNNNKIKASVRRLTTLSRQLHNLAKLQNATYRLVIDMRQGSESPDPHEYWIEKSTNDSLIAADRKEAYEERLQAQKEAFEETKDYTETNSGFSMDQSLFKDKQELPYGIIFDSVELKGFEKPITAGIVYIHYFASGLSEEAAVHLKLDKLNWTLAIHPLTGKADIITKKMSLKEIIDQE